MIRSVFSKLAFCSALIVGLSLSFASAEETAISPTVIYYIESHSDQSGYTTPITQESSIHVVGYPWNQTTWILGYVDTLPNSLYLYSQSAGVQIGGIYADRIGYSYYGYYMPDLNVSLDTLTYELDVSSLSEGYYRLETDICFGIAGQYDPLYYVSGTYSNIPAYSSSSSDFWIQSNGYDIHCSRLPDIIYTSTFSNAHVIENLVHYSFEVTFYLSSEDIQEEYISFPVTSALNSLGKYFSYDYSWIRSINRSQTVTLYRNNRVKSVLYANVAPPVTPTPSPTPYPGQDTQESINAGVQVIVNALDISATPVPTPIGLELDETVFDQLETVTLPDMSNQQVTSTFTSLWSVFDSLWSYLGILFASIVVVSVFCFVIGGRWL